MDKELSAFEKAALKAAEDLSGFKDAFKIAKDIRENKIYNFSKTVEDIEETSVAVLIEPAIPADKAKEDSIETISRSMYDIWTKIKKASNKGQTHITADITLDQEWVLMQLGYEVVDGYHTDSKEAYRCSISWR